MTIQEGLLFFIYLFLLVLIALRFLLPDKGRVARRIQVGKAMTIGDRQVQEDNYGMCQTGEGFLAVLADGMGKAFRLANTRILEQLEEGQAGACAAAILIRDKRLYYEWRGKS